MDLALELPSRPTLQGYEAVESKEFSTYPGAVSQGDPEHPGTLVIKHPSLVPSAV